MPFVEDRAITPPDSAAWIGANVATVTPALFCALGQVEVAGLWRAVRLLPTPWRAVKPPVGRGWKPPVRGHQGGF